MTTYKIKNHVTLEMSFDEFKELVILLMEGDPDSFPFICPDQVRRWDEILKSWAMISEYKEYE